MATREYESMKQPCLKNCLKHKYHCAKCLAPCSYSPANYSSRLQDIPSPCENCLPTPTGTFEDCKKCEKDSEVATYTCKCGTTQPVGINCKVCPRCSAHHVERPWSTCLFNRTYERWLLDELERVQKVIN